MIESTLIFRQRDGLPLAASVDGDASNDPGLLKDKKYVKLIVSRITPNSQDRASITTESHTIHYLLAHELLFVIITEQQYPKKLAFSYLSEIAKEFTLNYKPEEYLSTASTVPYSYMAFDNFIQKTKKLYQDSTKASVNLDRISSELEDVKAVLNKNIEDLLYRGDSLDRMSDISSSIKFESSKYRKAAKKINFDLLIRQYAPVAVLSLFVLLLLYFAVIRRLF